MGVGEAIRIIVVKKNSKVVVVKAIVAVEIVAVVSRSRRYSRSTGVLGTLQPIHHS